jgi:hypothetical protein
MARNPLRLPTENLPALHLPQNRPSFHFAPLQYGFEKICPAKPAVSDHFKGYFLPNYGKRGYYLVFSKNGRSKIVISFT